MSLKSSGAKAVLSSGLLFSILTGSLIYFEGSNKDATGQHIPYKDVGGVPTYCYGQTGNVDMTKTYSDEDCYKVLKPEAIKFLTVVDETITAPATPIQIIGMTAFAYNIGEGAFKKSTFARLYNEGNPKACEQMLRWVWVGGKDCRISSNNCSGIVKRREEEYKLCMGGI